MYRYPVHPSTGIQTPANQNIGITWGKSRGFSMIHHDFSHRVTKYESQLFKRQRPCAPQFPFPPQHTASWFTLLSSVRAIHLLPTFSPLTILILDLRAKADEESISKLKAKLVEASNVYSNDKETISWFVMQSVFDKQDFTIVERYEKESSQEYHLNNPYWKTFDPYVIPLLEKDMDMHRLEELEGSTM